MATVLEQLEAMRSVPENWDGYGGASTQGSAIDLAADFVRFIEAALLGRETHLHVCPTPPGGVLIALEDDWAEHDIHIEPDGSIGFVTLDKASGQIDSRTFSSGARAAVQLGFLPALLPLLAPRGGAHERAA